MKPTLRMTEFDELTGSSSLQMMKAFLPFLEPSMQQWAAVYIRMQELQNTIALFQTPDQPLPWPRRSMPPPEKLIEELKPYGGPTESAALDQMKNALEAMKLYQKISELQQKTSGPLSPSDLIQEMLPPEQAAMFETYSTMFQGMDFMNMMQGTQD
ncbi:MAG: hypothetical protein HFI38_03110 [Lachnospiraceae bacterium]|jgi:hypothetical protein|nr:hypothetical protein [Lachnospiraceae bacterium]